MAVSPASAGKAVVTTRAVPVPSRNLRLEIRGFGLDVFFMLGSQVKPQEGEGQDWHNYPEFSSKAARPSTLVPKERRGSYNPQNDIH